MCVCVHMCLSVFYQIEQTQSQPILSLICSSLHMSHLTSGWNEFKKVPYFSKVLSFPTGAIFRLMNHEITNAIMSYIHLHRELEKEQVRGEFTEKNFFLEVRGRIGRKSVKDILECGCYIWCWSFLKKKYLYIKF